MNGMMISCFYKLIKLTSESVNNVLKLMVYCLTFLNATCCDKTNTYSVTGEYQKDHT